MNDTPRQIEQTPGAHFMYHGDHPDWPITFAVNRDSDPLDRSNFAVAQTKLAALDPHGDTYVVERFNHWLCGWTDNLLVMPESPAHQLANLLNAQIDDYPVLDDDHYSQLEWDTNHPSDRECYDPDHLTHDDCPHICKVCNQPLIDCYCEGNNE